MKIVIANLNPIHRRIESICEAKYEAVVIHNKDQLTYEYLKGLEPHYVFFLHWSFIIPADIYDNFSCVVFHMTDLPFGRGGSPLQNLIVRGYQNTVISALQVRKGIDTGPVYMKRPLSLSGSAEQIFMQAGHEMLMMIDEIVATNPEPIEQQGKITHFARRTPKESNLQTVRDLRSLYDQIRMVDAPGYPKAFIETADLRFEFSVAEIDDEGEVVTAKVKITKK